MYSDQELCGRITSLYPDIGECGTDVEVLHDEAKNTWVVDLKKNGHKLQHYLDYTDADSCMEENHCVSLGLEVAQLRNNIEGQQF